MNFIEGAGISKSLFIIAATMPSRKKAGLGWLNLKQVLRNYCCLSFTFFYLDFLNFSRMPEGFDTMAPSSYASSPLTNTFLILLRNVRSITGDHWHL